MAIQKSIVGNTDGVTYATAYTQINEIRVNTRDTQQFVQVAWESYADASARSKGNDGARQFAIKGATYMVSTSDCDTYFADSVLLADTKSLWSQAYLWLKTQNDTELDIDWTTGTTDV
tara:strand:+ start:2258 stop:2611 length:354 start_codon:yes stop_codon:yes gene_type:complete